MQDSEGKASEKSKPSQGDASPVSGLREKLGLRSVGFRAACS